MRIALEPMAYAYGVDLFFYGAGICLQLVAAAAMKRPPSVHCDTCAGHVHAYERSTPVYNFTVDLCGPVHITIGRLPHASFNPHLSAPAAIGMLSPLSCADPASE